MGRSHLSPASDKKNLIIILADALRYDHVNEEITPNIMRIARKGEFYTEAWSPNTCTIKSMPYLLSASYEYDSENSLPVTLSKHGYFSCLINTNPSVKTRFSEGWGEVNDFYYEASVRSIRVHLERIINKYFLHRMRSVGKGVFNQAISSFKLAFLHASLSVRPFSGRKFPYTPADEMLKFALTKIDQQPYFLWIHLMDPHGPYYPRNKGYSKQFLDKYYNLFIDVAQKKARSRVSPEQHQVLKQLYKENVMEMDEAIGQFYDQLNNNTVLFLLSDHGEAFGEEGHYIHPANTFIPALHHVPLIIAHHGRTGINEQPMQLHSFPQFVYDVLQCTR
ncbi:MAG: sulfatase-like hydrolase/transferase [Candidatus Bathyarchaeota archaeon]|nr:MAG: sulfatase-like hydrolase/transferase [Candidatus Bathyarchaeota archaeon]